MQIIAKSIQKEADDVWTVFDDFVQNGPVEIGNIQAPDAEIEEKFLEIEPESTELGIEIILFALSRIVVYLQPTFST